MLPRTLPALALLFALAQPLAADPLPGSEARALLFHAERTEVARFSTEGLSPEQAEALTGLAMGQRYYAALAFAPDAGIIAEPSVFAANHHSRDAARAAALAGCEERRNGGRPCTLALEVRPAGWEARALSLSAAATEAFEREYRRLRGERALAISPSSGAWGIASGEGAMNAAVERCAADRGDEDCVVVIAD